jgi:hypothetical protein
MAREAGSQEYGPLTRNWSFELTQLKAFEALVRADERARLQPKKINAAKDEYCHGDERYYANE